MAQKTHKATALVTDLSVEELTPAPAPKNGRAHLVVKNDDAKPEPKVEPPKTEPTDAAKAEAAAKDASAAEAAAKAEADAAAKALADQAAKDTAAVQGAKDTMTIVMESPPSPIAPAAKRGLVAALSATVERLTAAIARVQALPEDPAATYIPWEVWSPITFACDMLCSISGCCSCGCSCGFAGCQCCMSCGCGSALALGSPDWEVAVAAAGAKNAEQAGKAGAKMSAARLKKMRAAMATLAEIHDEVAPADAAIAGKTDAAPAPVSAELAAKNDEVAKLKADAELAAKSLAEATAALEAEKAAHAATAEQAKKNADLASKAARTVTPSQSSIVDRARSPEAPVATDMPLDLSQLRPRAQPRPSTRR